MALALKAQDEQRWAQALEAYEQVLRVYPQHPEVLYNMGTAAIKAGQLARARVALERAMLYKPQDGRISANLEVVTRMIHLRTLDRLRGRAARVGAADPFGAWNLARRVNPSLLATLLLLSAWTLAIALLARQRLSAGATRDALYGVAWLAAALIVGSASAWLARERVMTQVRPGVVLIDDALLREGPSEHAAKRQRAHPIVAGMKLSIEEEREGWIKLRLPDESTGWISAQDVAQLR